MMMSNFFRLYDCPACGAKESSWDGVTFCGPCEADYQASLSDEFREMIRKHPEHW